MLHLRVIRTRSPKPGRRNPVAETRSPKPGQSIAAHGNAGDIAAIAATWSASVERGI
jgi:hypothetical protein